MARDKYVGKHRAKPGKGGAMKDAGGFKGGHQRSLEETRAIPKLTKKKLAAEDDAKADKKKRS